MNGDLPRRRRLVRPGETYTLSETVELEDVPPDPDPPPEETRGEPWGWTKGPPYPRGWPHAPRGWRGGENFDDTH